MAAIIWERKLETQTHSRSQLEEAPLQDPGWEEQCTDGDIRSGYLTLQACRCPWTGPYWEAPYRRLGGSLWAIQTCLLARRGDVSDEEHSGSQVDHWHLCVEGGPSPRGRWAFSMTRGPHWGRDPHPVREGTSLTVQLTSPENPFMISPKSISLGWEVSHRTAGRKGNRWKRETEEETCRKHGLRQVFFCPTF